MATDYIYDPKKNPLLIANTATTDLNGEKVTQAVTPTASKSGADTIASALGGSVVPLSRNTTWTTSAKEYGIQLPDGRIIDAAAVAGVIGNDAAFPSEASKAAALRDMVDYRYQPIYGTELKGAATAPAAPKKADSTTASALPSGTPGAVIATASNPNTITPPSSTGTAYNTPNIPGAQVAAGGDSGGGGGGSLEDVPASYNYGGSQSGGFNMPAPESKGIFSGITKTHVLIGAGALGVLLFGSKIFKSVESGLHSL